MEPRNSNTNPTQPASIWHTVTPLSRYLALALFITLPFVGGWIGYTIAPETVISQELTDRQTEGVQERQYRNTSLGIEFAYPSDWSVTERESKNEPSYTGQQIVLEPNIRSDGAIIAERAIVVMIMDNARLGPAHQTVRSILDGTATSRFTITEATSTQVSGIDAVSYIASHEGAVLKMTFFEHNGHSYFIQMSIGDDQKLPANSADVYQQLIRSFKLLE